MVAGRAVPAAAQATATPTPKRGGVLVATPVTAAASFSIHEEATISTVQVAMPCYGNLLLVDQAKPRASEDTLVGELAERWEWQDRGRALALALRKGVTWHDGKPFGSADVRHTFDLLREAPGTTARLRVNPRKDWYTNVQGVDTPDAHTAIVRLKRPQPSLLMMLGSGYSPVYPAHVAPAELRQKPVGTGPFRFVRHQVDQVIELERNPDYFVKGRPYLDGIRFMIISKRETQMAAVVTGQVDIGPLFGVTRAMAEAAVRNNPKLRAIETATNTEYNVLMNTKKPPFANPKVRLAVSLAVDRRGFQRGVMQGDAILSATMLPPPDGAWGIPASELATTPGFGDPAESKARARALLAEAGFGPANPLKLAIATRLFAAQPDAAAYVASELALVGVSATVDTVETALWYSRLNRHEFLIAVNATGRVDDPDPTFYENYACGSPRNYGDYCNAEVDRLIELQSSTTDRAKRRELVLEIQRRIEADAARPILGFAKQSVVFWPHVRGFVPHTNIHNYHRMQDVWLDK
jgi:peptide/nickel transport system substrate-binding protein